MLKLSNFPKKKLNPKFSHFRPHGFLLPIIFLFPLKLNVWLLFISKINERFSLPLPPIAHCRRSWFNKIAHNSGILTFMSFPTNKWSIFQISVLGMGKNMKKKVVSNKFHSAPTPPPLYCSHFSLVFNGFLTRTSNRSVRIKMWVASTIFFIFNFFCSLSEEIWN